MSIAGFANLFLYKGQRVNVLGFAGQALNLPLSHYSLMPGPLCL